MIKKIVFSVLLLSAISFNLKSPYSEISSQNLKSTGIEINTDYKKINVVKELVIEEYACINVNSEMKFYLPL